MNCVDGCVCRLVGIIIIIIFLSFPPLPTFFHIPIFHIPTLLSGLFFIGVEPGAVGCRAGLFYERGTLPETFDVGNRYHLVLLSGRYKRKKRKAHATEMTVYTRVEKEVGGINKTRNVKESKLLFVGAVGALSAMTGSFSYGDGGKCWS